jgi:hypothetical protein
VSKESLSRIFSSLNTFEAKMPGTSIIGDLRNTWRSQIMPKAIHVKAIHAPQVQIMMI